MATTKQNHEQASLERVEPTQSEDERATMQAPSGTSDPSVPSTASVDTPKEKEEIVVKDDGEKEIVYITGLPFWLILIALCLAVFVLAIGMLSFAHSCY